MTPAPAPARCPRPRRAVRPLAAVALALLAIAAPAPGRAQDDAGRPGDAAPGGEPRRRLVVGAAVGGGTLHLTGRGVAPGTRGAVSLPNLRIGYRLSSRTALVVALPGSLYRYRGDGAGDRPRYRGFEAVVPSVQRWTGDRWWVSGGVGLALDSPAFFDVRGASEGRFHAGPAASVAAGYALRRRGRVVWDVEARAHGGRTASGTADERRGLAVNLLLGAIAF